ncbi:spore cortex biosynthesis protein YabQ [Bacillus sp. REN10]|uniref:spore cortex biosynthesis protein YabQ n=1 Tax=Bacillus sp. REN10 TaxID=2782541 RepID=UPI00193B2D42|nr:spore cortex biosynthesis protein YabQ [Bacillus sp. REN10]
MTLSVQFETLIAMIVMGLIFGALLDTYQRFLQRPTRSRWISFISDVIFWCLYAGVLFYSLYKINYGEIRVYVFLAVLCGFAAYQALFKFIYLKILEWIIAFFTKVFFLIKKTIYFLFIWPVIILFKWTMKCISLIGKAVMALAKMCLRLLLWIGKVILFPVGLILKLLPLRIRNQIGDITKKVAGVFLLIKNQLINISKRWNK